MEHDLVLAEEQAYDGACPIRDAASTIVSQGNSPPLELSITSTTPNSQSSLSNYFTLEIYEPSVAVVQDSNRVYNIQPGTIGSSVEYLPLLQEHQPTENFLSPSTQGATYFASDDTGSSFGKFAGIPGPHRQLLFERRVPDTAHSIWLAIKGDIIGLSHLFDQGLASPTDVSNSRGFSLVRVSVSTPLFTLVAS